MPELKAKKFSEDCDSNTIKNIELASIIKEYLKTLNQKFVLAESCTGGEIASTFAKVAGISECFCGSIVSYRASSKKNWLSVDQKTIEKHTTESLQVAKEMAKGSIKNTPEADWSVSIVGHFGQNIPKEMDGKIFICVAKRKKNGKAKIKQTMETSLTLVPSRVLRQRNATEAALSFFARELLKNIKAE